MSDNPNVVSMSDKHESEQVNVSEATLDQLIDILSVNLSAYRTLADYLGNVEAFYRGMGTRADEEERAALMAYAQQAANLSQTAFQLGVVTQFATQRYSDDD